jgi:hypothetical protein
VRDRVARAQLVLVHRQQSIDDDYLREWDGFETPDFACYQMVPGVEPPLLLKGEGDAGVSGGGGHSGRDDFDRGDVKALTEEQKQEAAADRANIGGSKL